MTSLLGTAWVFTAADASVVVAVIAVLGSFGTTLLTHRRTRVVRSEVHNLTAKAEQIRVQNEEIRVQVKENGHTREEPTLLDRFDDVSTHLRAQDRRSEAHGRQITQLQRQLDRHIDWHHNVPADEEPDL